MANARDIRRRIKSIKNTQQITKAMKMVAAAKLRRAQESVIAARPFTQKTREVLANLASAGVEAEHPLLVVREAKKIAYVLVSADRGLCGGFNANLIRKTAHEIAGFENLALIPVGRKGYDFFRTRGITIDAQFTGLGDSIRFEQAKEIAKTLIDGYSTEKYDEVYLVFSEFISVLNQKPTTIKLLPIEPPEEKVKTNVDYIFEPSAEVILDTLLPKYVETTVYRALLESKASELGAKMTAMGAATDNATKIINKLTLSLNRARQAAITKEISEIVGGAAALE